MHTCCAYKQTQKKNPDLLGHSHGKHVLNITLTEYKCKNHHGEDTVSIDQHPIIFIEVHLKIFGNIFI